MRKRFVKTSLMFLGIVALGIIVYLFNEEYEFLVVTEESFIADICETDLC